VDEVTGLLDGLLTTVRANMRRELTDVSHSSALLLVQVRSAPARARRPPRLLRAAPRARRAGLTPVWVRVARPTSWCADL
jgi:hypothetical protein